MKYAPVVALSLFCLPALGMAQSPPHEAQKTGPASEASPFFLRYHDMPKVMDAMAREMSQMQREMEAGPLTPEAERDMAKRMEAMSRVMRRMSGLADRPSMSDAEMKREYEQMQRDMDAMSHKPAGKR